MTTKVSPVRRVDPSPAIAAWGARLIGLLDLLSVAVPRLGRVHALELVPGLVRTGGSGSVAAAATVASGIGLLLLAGGLRRSNRWAWRLTVALLLAGIVAVLVRGSHAEGAVIDAILAGWLLGKSREFRAKRGPGEGRHVLAPFVGLVVLTGVYGYVGLAVNAPAFVQREGFLGTLGQVARMAVGLGTAEPLRGAFGRFFPASVAAMFLVGAALILIRALAPRRPTTEPPPTREDLLASEDSLAYFATRDDRITVRARDGIVSYGAAGRVALAGGDPLGPDEAWPRAIEAFLAEAAATGRVPAVLGCGRAAAVLYERAGLRRFYLGEEAVLDLRTFDIETPERKGAREGWNRGRREGWTAALVRTGDLQDTEAEELRALSERWLAETEERGFSMALSRLFDTRDANTMFLLARGADGALMGFIHLVPWDRDGASFDIMRRDKDAPGVVNDFLIVEAARLLPEQNIRRMSLNFAFLRFLLDAAEIKDQPWQVRMAGRVLKRLSGSFQIESLYRFNQKFDPGWHRRYACVQSMADLPRVMFTMGRAEGQLTFPWDRWRKREIVQLPVAAAAEDGGGAAAAAAAAAPAEAVTRAAARQRSYTNQERFRREKLARLREAGIDPYPVGFQPTHGLGEVLDRWSYLVAGAESGEHVSVAGRIGIRRGLGGLTFWKIRQFDHELQVMLDRSALGDEAYRLAVDLDPADWVYVEGEVVRSKRGEVSVRATLVILTCKSLRPLPSPWQPLTDVEVRHRQRELDLAVNAPSRAVMRKRVAIIDALREVMHARDYLEVEPPILQYIHGGATARPFITHHNALNAELYLRIASELYLKRLLVGGVPKVYELNKMFRNEGMSPRHNPEFTMMESNEVYADYRDMMRLAQDLIGTAADAVDARYVDVMGRRVDLRADFRELSILDSVKGVLEIPDLSYEWPVERLRELADRSHIPWLPHWGPGMLVYSLFEYHVEDTLIEPTFITDYPVETSPLSHQHRDDPFVTERFELFIGTREYGNAYSELTDPIDQRERFEAQALSKAGGDEEAMEIDEAYLRALELGLPPNAGLGIGVDRLIMLLCGVDSIREVILFPHLRPEEHRG